MLGFGSLVAKSSSLCVFSVLLRGSRFISGAPRHHPLLLDPIPLCRRGLPHLLLVAFPPPPWAPFSLPRRLSAATVAAVSKDVVFLPPSSPPSAVPWANHPTSSTTVAATLICWMFDAGERRPSNHLLIHSSAASHLFYRCRPSPLPTSSFLSGRYLHTTTPQSPNPPSLLGKDEDWMVRRWRLVWICHIRHLIN